MSSEKTSDVVVVSKRNETLTGNKDVRIDALEEELIAAKKHIEELNKEVISLKKSSNSRNSRNIAKTYKPFNL